VGVYGGFWPTKVRRPLVVLSEMVPLNGYFNGKKQKIGEFLGNGLLKPVF